MKKNIILSQTIPATTIGIDLSDRTFQFCELNAAGEIVDEGQRKLDRTMLRQFLAGRPAGARVAFETGGHSAWEPTGRSESTHGEKWRTAQSAPSP